MTPRRARRGFTLIELMVVVCVIGLLSTVALPIFRKATLRTRVAERATILQAMRTGVEDAFVRNRVPPGGLAGAANPAGAAGVSKRPFQNSIAGWSDINIVIQGNTYYTYEFAATEATQVSPATYWLAAVGDLDGDGVQSTKLIVADRAGGHWAAVENPPAGMEDEVSFGTF